MNVQMNDDGTISITASGRYTAQEARELMQQIAEARARIAQEPPQPPSGANFPAVLDPAYYLEYGPHTNGHGFLAFSFAGYGWMGMLLPMYEVARLAHHLNAQLAASLSPAAKAQDAAKVSNHGGGTVH